MYNKSLIFMPLGKLSLILIPKNNVCFSLN